MVEGIEMQHTPSLHTSLVFPSVFIGIATSQHSLAHAHHRTVGPVGMSAFVLTVYGQFHPIVPLVVEHKVHVVYLVRIGLVNRLFLHLSGHHVQVSHDVVGRQVLVGAQLEAVVFLHAAISHEDERTEVLYDALIPGILVDQTCFSPPLVPGLGEASLVELHTVLQGGHVQVVASGVKVLVGAHTDTPSVPQGCGDVGIDGLTAEVV